MALSLLVSCNMPANLPQAAASEHRYPVPGNKAASPPPAVPETLISFRVVAPPNTPDGTQVFLSILDEVTGLALNALIHPYGKGRTDPRKR